MGGKIVQKPTTTENVALKSEDPPTEGVEQPTNVKYEVTPEAIEEIHNFVEEMPQFKGDIMLFLSKNIKYPALAQELGLQGKVICQFVVDRNGAIENVEVVRGIDKSLDNEAVRVIKSMPNWKPRPKQTLFKLSFSITNNINKAYHPEKEDEQPYMKHHN